MPKLSELQEAFCQNIVKGMSQQDAYIEAGYKCDPKHARTAASRLSTNVNISERIAELRRPAVESAEIDAEWLLRESVDSYKAARKDGAHGAANALLKTIGVYSGDWNEKSTRENINKDADDYSADELAAIIEGAGSERAASPKDGSGKTDTVH